MKTFQDISKYFLRFSDTVTNTFLFKPRVNIYICHFWLKNKYVNI